MSTNFAKDPVTSFDSPMGHEPSRTEAVDRIGAAGPSPSRTTVGATILAAATLVILPYLLRGYTLGHDIAFHASWWLDVSGLWRQGVLHPRWAELAYYGYGEPAFVFYPPLSLYLGGMLTSLLPFRLVPGVYVWLVLVLAGFSFYYLCRQFLDARYSLLGAVVYVINPYHLLQVHARYSFAELLVGALLPLLLLAIYRLGEPGGHRIAIAAILFAAISLTNMPGAVVGSYSAFAFLVALMMARKSGTGLAARFVAAAVLGAGLAAFHLLPSWFEQRWVLASIHSMTPPEGQFVRLGSMPYNRFIWLLAGVEVGQIVIGALAWALCRRTQPRGALRAFTAVFAVSILMVLPISAVIWRIVPFLHYVQFPWRWLGPMGLAMSFFVAAAACQSRKGLLFAAGVCALCLAMIAAITVLPNIRADHTLSSLETSITQGRGYLGWPYVLPRDIKIDQFGIPEHLTSGDPLVTEVSPEIAGTMPPEGDSRAPAQNASRIAITRWSPEAREVTIDAPQPAWIRFRLFRYPGWYAYVDGKLADTVTTDARGAMVLRVPSGHSEVKLLYQRTLDQTWGIGLSLLSLLCLLWMFRRKAAAESRLT